MPGFRNQMLVALVAGSASCTVASAAGVLTTDGSAGTNGTPYGYLGAGGAKYWEQYRKGFDQYTPPYPNVTGASVGASNVTYSNVRQGMDTTFTTGVFRAPGVFVGPAGNTIDPAHRFQFIETTNAPRQFDVRLAFAESGAAGGGNPFSTFVSTHGGDNGANQDLFYGSWGVDGAYLGLNVSNNDANWIVGLGRANVVTATATAEESATPQEPGRTNYSANVVATGGTPSGPNIDTGIPTTIPLSVDWSLSGTTLKAVLGGTVTYTWAFDGDIPGNPDGIDFQGGSFDPAHVVPVMFAGWSAFNVTNDSQPATSQTFGIGPVTVPEPGALLLLGLFVPTLLSRRSRLR